MTISMTNDKKNKIKNLCDDGLSNPTSTIHEVGSIVGNTAASFETAPYGQLQYRYLEQKKIMALRKARGYFESPCKITREASKHLIWQRGNTSDTIDSLYPTPEFNLTNLTDPSNKGWGASTNDETINGKWNESEQFLLIYELESLVIRDVGFSITAIIS